MAVTVLIRRKVSESKWETEDDWSMWLILDERRAYQERIDDLTGATTRFEIYEH